METDRVHVVLAANGPYMSGLELTKASMIASADDASRLVFHEFTEWPTNLVLPRQLSLAYIRLFLSDLLSELDYVVWSDVDVLWKRDIAELWALRKDDIFIMAPRDQSLETLESECAWMHWHGYGFDANRYFCSGVMLMNLKKMREEGFVGRCLEFIGRHDDVLLADQSVLNALYQDKVEYLEGVWNVFSRNATKRDFVEGGVVIHFAGEAPWLFRDGLTMFTDTRVEWFKAYAKLVGKCTLREVLNSKMNIFERFYRRVLFFLAASPLTWPLIKCALSLTGRGKVASRMKIWARRV